jgi:Cys-rich protein (TIGR01571 family)
MLQYGGLAWLFKVSVLCVIMSMEQPPIYGQETSNTIQYREMIPSYINKNWSSGICECCSGPNANCCTCCFACCSNGLASGVLMEELDIVDSCACSAMIGLLLEIFTGKVAMNWVLFSLRRNIAKKLQREESLCCSCYYTCCCQPCAIAQMERDAKDRGYKFEKPNSFAVTTLRSFGYIDNLKPVNSGLGSEMVPLIPYTSNQML